MLIWPTSFHVPYYWETCTERVPRFIICTTQLLNLSTNNPVKRILGKSNASL